MHSVLSKIIHDPSSQNEAPSSKHRAAGKAKVAKSNIGVKNKNVANENAGKKWQDRGPAAVIVSASTLDNEYDAAPGVPAVRYGERVAVASPEIPQTALNTQARERTLNGKDTGAHAQAGREVQRHS
ncbi:hypothetical protein LX32DRAFT_688015 [Colletotrichum zoysiae]|uniref:Uncharacterized protein n=1 Tax=Colletotrichum zoysiae TaxID=1216348 RepID=A0AAD9H3T6_9PEZI|nr:hypothetical protein LX32DRAFT_688015 [Colletotrichum zoysiae]